MKAISVNYSDVLIQFADLGIRNDLPIPSGLSARRAICQPFAL
jgi:hypothetical protein